MDDVAVARLVGLELQHEIEQFLYHEASLLDDRRFDTWYELLDQDLQYWMPVRRNVTGDSEFSGPSEMAVFDDTKESMGWRVARLATGMAWAEEPPSRTRRLVTNVRTCFADEPDELEVESYFMLYRTRLETIEDLFVGLRQDRLRRARATVRTRGGGQSWRIARRTIRLDQGVLLANNISVFF
jgi:3-phenylpropionate/cinnamic acid dioxygenase small subunit